MNKIQWILLISIVIVSSVCSVYYGYNYSISSLSQRATSQKQHVCEPLDVYQLQTFLTKKGYYKGKIDGWCGRFTHDARDRYFYDKSAIKYMTVTGAPNDISLEEWRKLQWKD